jgi:hypothetical protein
MTLINELLEAIESNPSSIEARVLLLQQWIAAGWNDAARDAAQDLLRLDPSNAEARQYLQMNNGARAPPAPTGTAAGTAANSSTIRDRPKAEVLPLPRSSGDRAAMELEFSEGYEALHARAELLLRETRLVRDLPGDSQRQGVSPSGLDSVIKDLNALSHGRMSAVVSVQGPCSVRAVARAMEADQGRAVDLAVEDLANVIRWRRSSSKGTIDNDALRETLAKRIRVLVAALPDDLQQHPSTALMHVEHEELGRTYVNQETMCGDAVADIRRSKFWVSEDGYAWDMEELADCLASNGGVMRNPLSRQKFAEDDVRAIVQHPLGRRLGAMQMEQSRLSQGIRPATITQLDQLSATLLADQSTDQMASRHALDGFLAYIATLPQAEQRAIDELRVPATDSHTGQPFDCTIGQAVRDARANVTCLQ